MSSMHRPGFPASLMLLLLPACLDRSPVDPAPAFAKQAVVPATPLVTLPGAAGARILPYLTDDLVTPQDPVNFVFTGIADPRAIRDALLGLDGSRGSPFPPVFPFTCVWSDAIGGLMAGYGEAEGREGAAVQLQCGSYGPIRFHLRLVALGPLTVGNAHFEVLIPGTTDHQVLSWELAEQLVTYDIARTGLLGAPPSPTAGITSAPSHRAIPAVIYNGLPVQLRALIGGPLADVGADVGIANDGNATTLALGTRAPPAAAETSQHLELEFNQVIPKPFCSGGPEYLLVQGPVTLDQEVHTTERGELRQTFRARGDLLARRIDPGSGQPLGEAYRAEVSERQDSRAADAGGEVVGLQHQQLLPSGVPGAGALQIRIAVRPGLAPEYDRKVACK